jgi:hypothetical protein
VSKILKNTTGSAINISDTGISIPASPGSYTIPATDYLLWAASSDVVGPVGTGDLIVNDGSVDLNASDGMDLIKGIFASQVQLVGDDEAHNVDVFLQNGVRRMQTSGLVQIEQLLGQDPIPDTWFTVENAGLENDTFRIEIAGTSNDPSSPDRDLPAVDFTYTVLAGEVGDELKVAKSIEEALNADTTFQNAKLKADMFNAELAVLHITSTERSLAGDFFERPDGGDVAVTTTGTADVTLAFDTLKSQGKATSLDRDPKDPRVGILGISGSVRVRADNVSKLFSTRAMNGGAEDLTVNGSGTPVIFTVNANPAGGDVKFVETVKLYGTDGNIKVGEENFMGTNAALSNGLEVSIYTNEEVTVLPALKTTNDLLARFATRPSDAEIINQSGGDYLIAAFDLVSRNISIVLEPGTTDRIEIKVQDDISSVSSMFLSVEGFEEEP